MNSEDTAQRPVTGPDLVGCRYRLFLDRTRGRERSGSTESGRRRTALAAEHRAQVLASLPGALIIEDGPDADLATLEAIAAGVPLIAGAVLRHERPWGPRAFAGIAEESRPELLVKLDDAPDAPGPRYMPVAIVPHKLLEPRKLRRSRGLPARVLPVARLGRPGVLGRGPRAGIVVDESLKLRHNAADAARVGQAAALLHRLGVSSGLVGGIGADATRVVVADEGPRVVAYRDALRRSRAVVYAASGVPGPLTPGEWPLAPRRIRECRACRWHDHCDAELREMDDISLLLPGNRADRYREAGVDTIRGLARTEWAGEHRYLAMLDIAGVPAARRVARPTAPRADVEIDVDLEAYPGHGAYLWGAWVTGGGGGAGPDGSGGAEGSGRYVPHVTWAEPGPAGLGGEAEAANFARFWAWLMARRAAAHAAGLTFRAYCWASEAENHWLRFSAERFAGMEFVSAGEPGADPESAPGGAQAAGPIGMVRVPSVEEVERFIGSDEWVDVFRVAKSQLISTGGHGLKVVAPMAGFHWRDEDSDGEASLGFYRVAVGLSDGDAPGARVKLLRYNEDDCRATAAVREWLDASEVPDGAEDAGAVFAEADHAGAGSRAGRVIRDIPFVRDLELVDDGTP